MKLFIYFEMLILGTFLQFISFFVRLLIIAIKHLHITGRTAEFYSKHNCHIWQQKKILEAYNKEYDEKVEEMLRKAGK